MAAKKKVKKRYTCKYGCGQKTNSPAQMGQHYAEEHGKEHNGKKKGNGVAPDITTIVSAALKAVDGEMRMMQRKLDRIRKILDE